jgi:poly(3-hydroxybutyrate) depolymerase
MSWNATFSSSYTVDELERDFFVQLLFSYKVNPRTVFFAGYSEGGAETQDFDMTMTGRAVFLKIGYAWLW